MSLSPEQIHEALALMKEYLDHPPVRDGQTPKQMMATLDENRGNSMVEHDLWDPKGDRAEKYIAFKHVYEERGRLFTEKSETPLGFYQIEHVFWFTGAHPYVS